MANLTAPFDIPQKVGDEIRAAQDSVKLHRGAAVGFISGTGYATTLAIATAGMRFYGISLDESDNSNGTPGTFTYNAPLMGYSPFVRLAIKGLFAFNTSGTAMTQANIGAKVWFADDNTVTLTPGAVYAGKLRVIDESGVFWFQIDDAVSSPEQAGWVALAGSTDAIPAHSSGNYIVTTAGVDAMTLAAPTATTDDGITIVVSSGTANAHTITATGLFWSGGTAVNTATFAAHPGASITLRAYQGKWIVVATNAVTMS